MHTLKGGEHIKIKDRAEKLFAAVLFTAILILVLPFLLLYMLFKLLFTPFDYIKYKRSKYQQDFPQKFKWLSGLHQDNEAYTAVKENALSVEYIKRSGIYELSGYFVYKDILLDFTEPFFYDKKKNLWLFCPDTKDDEKVSETDEENEFTDDSNTDDFLTVDGTKEYLLEQLRNDVPGRECKHVVFFYQRKKSEKNYGDGAAERIYSLDDFVVYEKGELTKAIKEFILKN